MDLSPKQLQTIKQRIGDRLWRLNNLYYIINEHSQRVLMQLRENQQLLYDLMDYWNLILKARQHGITTFIDVLMLDGCVFNPNVHAGIIAHDLKSAQRIFYNKILYPYDNLPGVVKDAVKPHKRDGMELRLSNGSSIWVGTSMRSSTLRMLHISELGKICAKFPKKAEEVKTGALPTLHEGSLLFVESTAEGAAGDFYNMATESESLTAQAAKQGIKLNKQQMKFHFYPWYTHPGNLTDPTGIDASPELERYFDELERKLSITLSPDRRAWYALKKDGPGGLGKLMKRENPSYPKEAFEQAVEGAVYGEELSEAMDDGRIGFYPWEQLAPVFTFWDLGYRDATSVIFAQFIRGEIRIIDYYEMKGRGAHYHAEQVLGKPYTYITSDKAHFGPHDVMNHEKGTGIVLKDTYKAAGIDFGVANRPRVKSDGIQAVRAIFDKVTFNEKTTDRLRACLGYYRYEWDEDAVAYKKDPVHDWASDAADALQTLAMRYRYGTIEGERIGYPAPIPANVDMDDSDEDFNPLDFELGRRAG